MNLEYDDSWIITVNDRVIKPILIGNCIMLVKLDLGTNEIIMKYKPKGVYFRISVSFFGVIFVLLSKRQEAQHK